jgi:hypothetical protein
LKTIFGQTISFPPFFGACGPLVAENSGCIAIKCRRGELSVPGRKVAGCRSFGLPVFDIHATGNESVVSNQVHTLLKKNFDFPYLVLDRKEKKHVGKEEVKLLG